MLRTASFGYDRSMRDEDARVRVTGWISKSDNDGNPVTNETLGSGGSRRGDGTLSKMVEDLEIQEDDGTVSRLTEDLWIQDDAASDDDGIAGLIAGLALVGLSVGAVAIAGIGSRRQRRRELEWEQAEARRQAPVIPVVQAPTAAPAGWYEIGDGRQQWWDGQNWTGQIKADVHRAPPPPGWYDDGAGSRRWWDGREWTAHTQGSLGATPQSLMVESVDAQVSANELQHVAEVPIVTMSSEEWRERARAMLVARAFSEEQWRLLSHARIEDGETALLEWQGQLKNLTPEEFSNRINHVLEARRGQGHQALTAGVNGGSLDEISRGDLPPQEMEVLLVDRSHTQLPKEKMKPPGWYNDHDGRARWWDGSRWAEY